MNITVTTPTGKVGRATIANLMKAGATLTLLVRDPGKVQDLAKRGAQVRRGALDDQSFILQATRGTDVLFWVTPTNPSSPDSRAYQERLGKTAAAAVRTNKIGRVVNLSSLGAQNLENAGLISGLGAVEKIFDQTSAQISHLRPTFFMENFFRSLPSIATEGRMFMPLPGDLKMPTIAAKDVGQVAAERILDDKWTGRSVIEFCGPGLHSLEESARILGEAIGKPIVYVTASDDQARAAMKEVGMSSDVAEKILEMYRALREGQLAWESKFQTTTTPLSQWAHDVFQPALQHAGQVSA